MSEYESALYQRLDPTMFKIRSGESSSTYKLKATLCSIYIYIIVFKTEKRNVAAKPYSVSIFSEKRWILKNFFKKTLKCENLT